MEDEVVKLVILHSSSGVVESTAGVLESSAGVTEVSSGVLKDAGGGFRGNITSLVEWLEPQIYFAYGCNPSQFSAQI